LALGKSLPKRLQFAGSIAIATDLPHMEHDSFRRHGITPRRHYLTVLPGLN
jgi:hypothetical protein